MDQLHHFANELVQFVSQHWDGFITVLGYLLLANIVTFVVPHIWVAWLRGPQNLKKKYQAEWGVVTGGSSGIGLSIVRRLAGQGLNVVIIAFPDKLMEEAEQKLPSEYPTVDFRFVRVNLGDSSGAYMSNVKEACSDITPQVIFLNAGFMPFGAFKDLPVEKLIANANVNSISNVWLSHFFLNKLAKDELKGCIIFTCSSAAHMPQALSGLYGPTKAFIASLATNLNIEAQAVGVDVHAVFPSPVASHFADSLDSKSQLKIIWDWFAMKPDSLPDQMSSAAGRSTVWREMGSFAFVTRLALKLFDSNMMAYVFRVTAPLSGEYKNFLAVKKQARETTSAADAVKVKAESVSVQESASVPASPAGGKSPRPTAVKRRGASKTRN